MRITALPPEILDRIGGLLCGTALVRLSHAVPYFKGISGAMHALWQGSYRDRFQVDCIDQLWPDPAFYFFESNELGANRCAVAALLRFAHRSGRSASLSANGSALLAQLVALVPGSMCVSVAVTRESRQGCVDRLRVLVDARCRIAALSFYPSEQLDADTTAAVADLLPQLAHVLHIKANSRRLPFSVCESLGRVPGLRSLEITLLSDFPIETLACIPHLTSAVFLFAQSEFLRLLIVSALSDRFLSAILRRDDSATWFARAVTCMNSPSLESFEFRFGGVSLDQSQELFRDCTTQLESKGWTVRWGETESNEIQEHISWYWDKRVDSKS
ncbi:hypothetical protein BC830DRAFT_1174959 [Chytriomyces sp. MP71]|nr:hypothetical protein BC830DRAFT_1174959 [Chytriomyces sp. MP71]